MPTIHLTVDLSAIQAATDEMRRRVIAAVDLATGEIAREVAKDWAAAIEASDTLSQEDKHRYSRALEIDHVGEGAWEVTARFDKARLIEDGRPARDLKKMLDTSLKVRLTKSGKRYLIIPFRHQTPGHDAHGPAMPKSIYRQARLLGKSEIIGTGTRPSANGGHVVKRDYLWAARLPAGLAEKANARHKTDRFAGMVRMKDAPTGGAVYLTFRCMHEDSPGWQVPARPGLHIAQAVATQAQGWAEAFIASAVQEATK